jgi:hypothetical protein
MPRIEVSMHFTRIGNQLIDLQRVQDVVVRENGILNIIVGPKPGTGLTVVVSQDEAWKHSFFRHFYRQDENDETFTGVIDLPPKGYDEIRFKESDEGIPAPIELTPKSCTCGPTEGCTDYCDRNVPKRKRIG